MSVKWAEWCQLSGQSNVSGQGIIGSNFIQFVHLLFQKINAKNAFGLHLIDYMSDLLRKKEMTNFQVCLTRYFSYFSSKFLSVMEYVQICVIVLLTHGLCGMGVLKRLVVYTWHMQPIILLMAPVPVFTVLTLRGCTWCINLAYKFLAWSSIHTGSSWTYWSPAKICLKTAQEKIKD